MRRWLVVACCVALAAGCSSGEGQDPQDAPPATEEAAPDPVEVAAGEVCDGLAAREDPVNAYDGLQVDLRDQTSDTVDEDDLLAAVQDRCGAHVAAVTAAAQADQDDDGEDDAEDDASDEPTDQDQDADDDTDDVDDDRPEADEDDAQADTETEPDDGEDGTGEDDGELLALGTEIDCERGGAVWSCSLVEVRVEEACPVDLDPDYDTVVMGRVTGTYTVLGEPERLTSIGKTLYGVVDPELYGGDGLVYDENRHFSRCHDIDHLISLNEAHSEGVEQEGWFAIPTNAEALEGGELRMAGESWAWQ